MSGEFLNVKTKSGVTAKMLNLVDFVWSIESETLGAFRAFDRSETSNEYKPRWLRADHITRRSPEIWSTHDSSAALEMIERVLAHHPKAYLVRMTRK